MRPDRAPVSASRCPPGSTSTIEAGATKTRCSRSSLPCSTPGWSGSCSSLDDIPNRPGLALEQVDLSAWLLDSLRSRRADIRLTLVPTEYVGTRPRPTSRISRPGCPQRSMSCGRARRCAHPSSERLTLGPGRPRLRVDVRSSGTTTPSTTARWSGRSTSARIAAASPSSPTSWMACCATRCSNRTRPRSRWLRRPTSWAHRRSTTRMRRGPAPSPPSANRGRRRSRPWRRRAPTARCCHPSISRHTRW